MKALFTPLALSATFLALQLAASPAQAHSTGVQIGGHDNQCNMELKSGVRLASNQVIVQRREGDKWQIQNGKLWRNGTQMLVPANDVETLRVYEQELRTLVPQIADVAHEGIQIGALATHTAFSTLLGADHQRIKHLDQRFAALEKEITRNLSRNEVHIDAFDKDSGELRLLGDAMALTGTVIGASMDLVGHAIHAAFDETYADELEKRADQVDKAIEAQVEARAEKLELSADAMCKTMQRLGDLEKQFSASDSALKRLDIVQP